MQRPSFSIYDASAGSGKTYALVKEYLKIILVAKNNDAYRNILAITFTNKAVHEMKSRIIGSLSEFAKDEPSDKALGLMQDLAAETELSIIQIKTKSQHIIKHIIHNYAAFDISTIDKFTHKVIRAFAHDLGLQMNFEVSLDTKNLLTEAVDAIIAQAGEDEVLTKLLVDFTIEKTDDDKSWEISKEILETGLLILNENNRNEVIHFQDKSISEFEEIKKKLKADCIALEKLNTEHAGNALQLIEKNGIDSKSFSRGTFPNHIQSIADGKFNPKNKMFHEFDDISINKTAKDRAIIEAIIPELLQILGAIYANFEKRDFYQAFLKNITPLSLLNTISNELSKIQEEQNVLSISEFNAIIHREIQNQPAPFIYERLGERYRHFFIDEFQDTSEMQWQNLIPLIDNATSSEINGEKGTLMVVGDPKQSIYRWRGGKAEQFIELSKDFNPFNNPEKVLVHLDKNYRSYSQVIDFNNDFFQMLSNEFEHEDYKELYANHSHQKSNNKEGGYVNISFIPKVEDSEEDEDTLDKTDLYLLATLSTIQKVLQQGFEYKDIAILTRKRSHGIAVANYLTEQGIPLLSSETLMIKNATEVQFIIHILKYLKNSADKESKAHFLYYLATNNQEVMAVHDFIAQGMAFEKETDFENWLEYIDVSLSFQNIRKKSLYEAVEIIVSKFLLPSSTKSGVKTAKLDYTTAGNHSHFLIEKPQEITKDSNSTVSSPSTLESAGEGNAYVQYFMDIVLERDIRNQAGVSDFLTFWDANSDKYSIPSPEGNNAVQIITIHKSKGLEFPVVIMPFAEEDYNKSPKNKLWIDTDVADFGIAKVLVNNSKAVEGFGEEAKSVYFQKSQEELLDNVNILYVALTRAEEQLYVISNTNLDAKGIPKKNNMASFFVEYLNQKGLFEEGILSYEFGTAIKLSENKIHIDTLKKIPVVTEILNSNKIKIAQREALMWGTHQKEAIEYGNLVHQILSYLNVKEDVDLAVAKALEEGLITIAQKESVCGTLEEIVKDAELSAYFAPGNEVLNERVIIQQEGGVSKPDRMVLRNQNEVLLLDYKTGNPEDKHKKQLYNYQKAIESMGYKVTKKSLVYIGETIDVVHL